MSLKTEHFRTVYTEVRSKAFSNTEITEKGSCDPETETFHNKHVSPQRQPKKKSESGVNLSRPAFVFLNHVALSSSLFGK